MSRARTNKENRPKRPSTLGLLLGGTGGRKDASKGAEAERQRRRRERDRSSEMAAYVGYDAMYRDGIVSVNIISAIFANVFPPIAPTRMRRIRQRGCAAFGV